MNDHPYLRAYMAGIVAPTVALLVVLTVFCVARFVYNVPAPIERLIVFPMAVVPNIFGLWNMLYVRLRAYWPAPIGLHGALLPFLLGPVGFVLARSLGFLKLTSYGIEKKVDYFGIVHISYGHAVLVPFFIVALYYLIWKYIVGFLNKLQGIGR